MAPRLYVNGCTLHITVLALSALSTAHYIIHLLLGTTVYVVATVYTTIHNIIIFRMYHVCIIYVLYNSMIYIAIYDVYIHRSPLNMTSTELLRTSGCTSLSTAQL